MESRRLGKLARKLNDTFRDHLGEAFKNKFHGVEIETSFNLTAGMVSRRLDEKDFTHEELDFIHAYEEGYAAAMKQVREAAA